MKGAARVGADVLGLKRSTPRRSRSPGQGREPRGALADRGHPRAAWLLRDDGRVPADRVGCRADRRTARSAVAPGRGRRRGDPHAQRGDPPDHRGDRDPRRPGGGDHPRARPSRRARRLRRPVERDGRGPADGLLRGPAGLVPERRGGARDPPARQQVLGLALHRAGRRLPPAERLRPPEGPHGRGRAADGLPARGRRPLHGRPRHGQPEGRLGGGRPRPRRGPGLRPGERRRLRGAGRRSRREGGAAGATGADGCAGRGARAARPADRSALRPPPGHRMVPGRRRLPDRPEPADHDAVPHPRRRRRGEPRLRLRRSSADDDRPDEAPGALRLAADRHPADVRGRREAVRRRHPGPGLAGDPGRHARPVEARSADRGRAADDRRTRRLPPLAPRRGSRRAAAPRGAGPDRDRPGDRHRADRAQPGLQRRLGARDPVEVRTRRCSTSSWRTSRS